jgi:hypothetical protein
MFLGYIHVRDSPLNLRLYIRTTFCSVCYLSSRFWAENWLFYCLIFYIIIFINLFLHRSILGNIFTNIHIKFAQNFRIYLEYFSSELWVSSLKFCFVSLFLNLLTKKLTFEEKQAFDKSFRACKMDLKCLVWCANFHEEFLILSFNFKLNPSASIV